MGKLKLQGKHLVLLQEGAAQNVGLCNTRATGTHTLGQPQGAPSTQGGQPGGASPCARARSWAHPSAGSPGDGAGASPQHQSGKHPQSPSVPLTEIQLGLCQQEAAAWRNASTF